MMQGQPIPPLGPYDWFYSTKHGVAVEDLSQPAPIRLAEVLGLSGVFKSLNDFFVMQNGKVIGKFRCYTE